MSVESIHQHINILLGNDDGCGGDDEDEDDSGGGGSGDTDDLIYLYAIICKSICSLN